MYQTLLAQFAATHPQTHVILLFGHARGFAEQVLDPLGNPSAWGLPNFTVADVGMPAYAPPTGKLTARSPGTATITVTSGSTTATSTISITPA